MASKPLIIAIDGPSGAGKGTVARTLAKDLGYRHVDTGAMYRAVGWKATRERIPLDDEAQVAAVADRADIGVEGGVAHVAGSGLPVTLRISLSIGLSTLKRRMITYCWRIVRTFDQVQ